LGFGGSDRFRRDRTYRRAVRRFHPWQGKAVPHRAAAASEKEKNHLESTFVDFFVRHAFEIDQAEEFRDSGEKAFSDAIADARGFADSDAGANARADSDTGANARADSDAFGNSFGHARRNTHAYSDSKEEGVADADRLDSTQEQRYTGSGEKRDGTGQFIFNRNRRI
jgi:hypothetical protein